MTTHWPNNWTYANANALARYAFRAGLRWRIGVLGPDRLRIVDTTDPEWTHDVTLSVAEAKELFEELTNIAALGMVA